MEITTTTTDQGSRRKAATSALAIVGFITLIIIGIALAIYAARYVPVALDRLGLAAVSFDAEYDPADEADAGISVIEPGESIPFEPIATTTGTTTVVTGGVVATNGTGTAQPARPATPTRPRTVTVPVTVPAPAPYGRADLAVDITATGYCSTDRPDSFRRATEVPDNENGGMQFTVSNIGTNTSGQWDFTYDLPTSPALKKTVANQRSLNPGDRLAFTLCFTEPRAGDNRTARVTVDTGRDVNESNENNNSDSAQIDIEN
jgi:hypothetical protein